MLKIISIVGKSNTGKTTLLEKIVKNLSKRGYRIGTIKHDTHDFEIDYPGKDSYRHLRSGSEMTMISGPQKIALVKRLKKPLNLDEIFRTFFNNKKHKLDLLITEGFKRENKPKIEVVRAEISSNPICRVKGDNLVALVSDVKMPNCNIPQFGLNDIRKISNFIKENFICQDKRKK